MYILGRWSVSYTLLLYPLRTVISKPVYIRQAHRDGHARSLFLTVLVLLWCLICDVSKTILFKELPDETSLSFVCGSTSTNGHIGKLVWIDAGIA